MYIIKCAIHLTLCMSLLRYKCIMPRSKVRYITGKRDLKNLTQVEVLLGERLLLPEIVGGTSTDPRGYGCLNSLPIQNDNTA